MARRKNVIAPNAPIDEKSLVAMEKMSSKIEKARNLYGDGQPFEEERVLDCIVLKAEQAHRNIEELGKYCLWYSTEAGHGNFLKGLQRRNIDAKAAYWAMMMVERFGSNFAQVRNLGARKARLLTAFTQEEIDTYAKGGKLRDIPHDDVAEMSTQELQETVRKERKRSARIKDESKKILEEKESEIERLQNVIDYREPLSEKEKAEKAIEAKLEKLRQDLFSNIQLTRFYFGKTLEIITTATRLEGVTFPMLEKWAKEEYEELAGFNELFEELDDALNYCNPDKGDGNRS